MGDAVRVKAIRSLLGKRTFVDVPFRIHGRDPAWVPPLRVTVYDRLSRRHPAMAHQTTALWVATRRGRPVGRVGACVDSAFNEYQGAHWGWVGFFDCFDDTVAAGALFDAALGWLRDRGTDTAVGPASFTTNDELGLMVEGFDEPPALMTTQNPPYYERLWVQHGWQPAMDLLGWRFTRGATDLSARQLRVLERLKQRSKLRVRNVNMDDWDNEVGRLFEIYNAAWEDNWGFAPMSEPEIRHLAKQLKTIINPDWAFGIETPDGKPVGVCLALPDLNRLMIHVRSGRLLPFGWVPLLFGRNRVRHARVWALGIHPDYENRGIAPLLYAELSRRWGVEQRIDAAEASWTLATNDRINNQIAASGGTISRRWRLYQRAL